MLQRAFALCLRLARFCGSCERTFELAFRLARLLALCACFELSQNALFGAALRVLCACAAPLVILSVAKNPRFHFVDTSLTLSMTSKPCFCGSPFAALRVL